jgi:hypothetical protein
VDSNLIFDIRYFCWPDMDALKEVSLFVWYVGDDLLYILKLFLMYTYFPRVGNFSRKGDFIQ